MNVIDIGSVLNKFDDTYDEKKNEVKSYGIQFITDEGRVRTMHCRKGVKAPKQQLTEGGNQERGKFRFNLKRNGTIMLHDIDINKTRTPKVAAIFAFRDHKSTNWLKVFH
jgi:hypothetical protein